MAVFSDGTNSCLCCRCHSELASHKSDNLLPDMVPHNLLPFAISFNFSNIYTISLGRLVSGFLFPSHLQYNHFQNMSFKFAKPSFHIMCPTIFNFNNRLKFILEINYQFDFIVPTRLIFKTGVNSCFIGID